MARILVIDDDPREGLELYREIPVGSDHEVLIAENGTQGLARVDRKPDLVRGSHDAEPERLRILETAPGHRWSRIDPGDRHIAILCAEPCDA